MTGCLTACFGNVITPVTHRYWTPHIEGTYRKQWLKKAANIMEDLHNPGHTLFLLLPLRRWYWKLRAMTSSFKNTFFPPTIRLLNHPWPQPYLSSKPLQTLLFYGFSYILFLRHLGLVYLEQQIFCCWCICSKVIFHCSCSYLEHMTNKHGWISWPPTSFCESSSFPIALLMHGFTVSEANSPFILDYSYCQ